MVRRDILLDPELEAAIRAIIDDRQGLAQHDERRRLIAERAPMVRRRGLQVIEGGKK